MEKIRKDDTLQYEVSVKYVNFRRDTFVVGFSAFTLIMVVGLVTQMGGLFGAIMGLLAMLAVMSDSAFKRQLFKMSFHEPEKKVKMLYSIWMKFKNVDISYKDLSYHVRNYQGRIQLKLYIDKKLWIVVDKNKYGWTDGRVQEAVRMLAYRDIKCIK